MTTFSANLNNGVVTEVYARRVRSGTPPFGGNDGWQFARWLRCNQYVVQAGADAGRAEFVVVTDGPHALNPIEDQLGTYGADDQVRVVQYPMGSELDPAPPEGEARSAVVFEGVLGRRRFSAAMEPAGEGGVEGHETVLLSAEAMPNYDNRLPSHLIAGRWMATDEDAFAYIETQDLPAIFNFRGRPNCHATQTLADAVAGTVTGDSFSHEHDPTAIWWTVQRAIRSILAVAVLGAGTALERSVCVDPALVAALAIDTEAEEFEAFAGEFVGLDQPLPELSIQGLGAHDALARVCEAAGFSMAFSPAKLWDGDTLGAGIDRSYILHICAYNRGRLNNLMLPKHGAAHEDAEIVLRDQANISRLEGMYDTLPIANHIEVTGRTMIEASIELKPLWSPSDMTDPEPLLASPHQLPPQDRDDWDEYLNHHVAGGEDFGLFGHVGRAWGLDLTGADSSSFYDAEEADYYHDPEGFDWAEIFDPMTEVAAERTAWGMTDPIIWTKRLRLPQPLTRPELAASGQKWVLRVSEDSGGTWADVTGLISFETLRDYFGIRLRVPNLATVSVATLGTNTVPAPAESWYQLILDAELRVELTCLVPADFALKVRAPRTPLSSTLYPRARSIRTEIEQVWASPDSQLNTSGVWQQVATYGTAEPVASPSAQVLAMALNARSTGEGHRVTASAYTWLMDVTRFRLLDRVWGVRGRDLPFAVRAGDETRCPQISAITVVTGPTTADQGITINLSDQALSAGRIR